MTTLSARLAASGVFDEEFNRLFPANPFDSANILQYISAGTRTLLDLARAQYPRHSVQFINPVFFIAGAIYPPPMLYGNTEVVKLTLANLRLIRQKQAIPLSAYILSNKLHGAVITSGSTPEYEKYLSLDTDLLPAAHIPLLQAASELQVAEAAMAVRPGITELPEEFTQFASRLGVLFTEDKIRLARAMVLYREFFKSVVGRPLTVSFVNNPEHGSSFFDFVFTLVSGQPFTEAELDDFSTVLKDLVSFPENYHRSGQTTRNSDKRAALIQRELLNSLRGLTKQNSDKTHKR